MKKKRLMYLIFVLIAVFHTAGAGSVVTVEALFVKRTLAGSYLELGAIFSLAGIVYALIAPYIGILADRYGKAKFLTIQLVLMGLASLSAPLMTQAFQYLPMKIFFSLVSPLPFPLLIALLMDAVSDSAHEGRLYSLFYISPALGGSLGSFFAGQIAAANGYQSGYVLSSALFFLAAILAFWLIPFDRERAADSLQSRRAMFNPLPSFRKIAKSLDLFVLLLLVVIFALHWVTRDIVYPFYLEHIGKDVATLGTLFATMGVAAALVMLVGGEIIDRFGPRAAVVLAFSIMSVSGLLIPATTSLLVFWLFNLSYAGGEALFSPSVVKIISSLVKRGRRAEVTMSISSLRTIVGVIWPVVLGTLLEFEVSSPRGLIMLAGIVVAAGTAISLVTMRRLRVRFAGRTFVDRIRGFIGRMR